jgi:hypothetical protein
MPRAALTAHAYKRLFERLQLPADTTIKESWIRSLLQTIRDGRAKLVQLGNCDRRLIYDVPTETHFYRGTLRLVVDANKTFVVSVVPAISSRELVKQRADAEGKRKRDFYRSLRRDDDGYEERI